MTSDEGTLAMQGQGADSHQSARRTAGFALDLSLAFLAPSLLIIDALLLAQRGSAAAELETMVVLVVLVPWVAFLPVAVRIWLRHVGLPTPGGYLRGERRRPRSGPLWVDTLLVAAAAFASLPLFYASQILPAEAFGAAMLVVVPVAMIVGSLFSMSVTASAGGSRRERS